MANIKGTKKLTEAERMRLDQIREQMGKLDAEARAIVEPTAEEIERCADMYADDSAYELAEIMMGSWGAWEDVLQDRDINEQEEEDEEEQNG